MPTQRRAGGGVCGERRTTYAELSRRADGLAGGRAGGLIQLGIKPLDRVVVHLPNEASP
ncbi:hypothetical protein ACIQCD_30805 [Streptomyces sp. NPDC093250]|uniref:hypothetical protein n=1 Tax=Streptomyces sp. NPDC093250 TaxID=3366036 RepID=UPI00382032BC